MCTAKILWRSVRSNDKPFAVCGLAALFSLCVLWFPKVRQGWKRNGEAKRTKKSEYVRAHCQPGTRAIHLAGMLAGWRCWLQRWPGSIGGGSLWRSLFRMRWRGFPKSKPEMKSENRNHSKEGKIS